MLTSCSSLATNVVGSDVPTVEGNGEGKRSHLIPDTVLLIGEPDVWGKGLRDLSSYLPHSLAFTCCTVQVGHSIISRDTVTRPLKHPRQKIS